MRFPSLILTLVSLLPAATVAGAAQTIPVAARAAGATALPRAHGPIRVSSVRNNAQAITETRGSSVLLPPLPPGVKRPFNLEVLTPALAAKISGKAGAYEIETPLRLRVQSIEPGWRLAIRSVDLIVVDGDKNDKIAAGEVTLKIRENETAPLCSPVPLPTRNGPGETIVEARVILATTGLHKGGTYKGALAIEPLDARGAPLPPVSVPLEVTVTNPVVHTIQNNNVYFHFGDPSKGQSAVVRGSVTGELPMRLTLSIPGGRIDRLAQVQTVSSKQKADENSIPVVWRLSEGAAGALRGPDQSASSGQSVSWVLKGTPGEVQYRLECSLTPGAFQAAGGYGGSLVLTLDPVL